MIQPLTEFQLFYHQQGATKEFEAVLIELGDFF